VIGMAVQDGVEAGVGVIDYVLERLRWGIEVEGKGYVKLFEPVIAARLLSKGRRTIIILYTGRGLAIELTTIVKDDAVRFIDFDIYLPVEANTYGGEP